MTTTPAPTTGWCRHCGYDIVAHPVLGWITDDDRGEDECKSSPDGEHHRHVRLVEGR